LNQLGPFFFAAGIKSSAVASDSYPSYKGLVALIARAHAVKLLKSIHHMLMFSLKNKYGKPLTK